MFQVHCPFASRTHCVSSLLATARPSDLSIAAHTLTAQTHVQTDGSSSSLSSRASATLAGAIMCLISACLISITLLLMDQARTHADMNAGGRQNTGLGGTSGAPAGYVQSINGGHMGSQNGAAPAQAHYGHV